MLARHLRSTTDLWLDSHPAHGTPPPQAIALLVAQAGALGQHLPVAVFLLALEEDRPTDLWLTVAVFLVSGLNGSSFEEAQFLERVIGIITGHDPSVPLFLYYPMHLVHSPLCVPEGYIERFDFIRDADDNINHDRQCKPTPPSASALPAHKAEGVACVQMWLRW